MSDTLARFAAKALGDAVLLRPRQTSWYAVSERAPTAPEDEGLTPETAGVSRGVAASLTIEPAVVSSPQRSLRAAPSSPATARAVPPPATDDVTSPPPFDRQEPRQVAASVTPPSEPGRPVSIVPSEPVAVARRPVRPLLQPLDVALRPSARNVPHDADVHPSSTVAPPVRAHHPPPTPARATPVPDGRDDEHRTLRDEPPPLLTPVLPLVRAAPLPAPVDRVRAARPVAAQPSAPDGPTIEVTIGRVEVRAVLPSPPPPRDVSRAASLSLDDFLRRRPGGRA